MRHTALIGPGGTGKTKLARMVAELMDAPFREVTAGSVRSMPDMTAALRRIEPDMIFFVDEWHRVAPMTLDQVIYPALSDRVIYVATDGEPQRVVLPPFTLIAATTHARFDPSMARRFKTIVLDYYSVAELTEIIIRAARGLEPDPFTISPDAALYLAQRSQGVAGVAQQLLADAVDETSGEDVITLAHTVKAMERSEVDALGLGKQERKILEAVAEECGRPIGIESIKAITGEREIDEQVAFLTRMRLMRLAKGRQGRVATVAAYAHLGWDHVPPMVRGMENDQR
jgi:Holliday junction DNA helicase RuvB